jgi:hypothetical protein
LGDELWPRQAKVAEQLPRSSRFGSLEAASAFLVQRVYSSFFSDASFFPAGSVSFDCGLLMRNIEHSWRNVPALRIPPDEQATRLQRW